ncbi:MAG: carbohydrate binding family 9 domain-containing protein, partial [Bacteroidia bacterium]
MINNYLIKFFNILFIALVSHSYAQLPKKETYAVRIELAPKIDGLLTDDCWNNANIATGFTQRQINTGQPATQHTEVKVLYDDVALYVGAILYDVSNDSILREVGERDMLNSNSDQFGVYFDTYNDAINAYGFIVNAAGVQTDIRYSPNGEDFLWNAVWDSKVKIEGNNWYVELKIPFSTIRFADIPIQKWGVNFMRGIRRHREISYWNFVDPANEGFVNQFGILNGIENIVSPIRLSLTPY